MPEQVSRFRRDDKQTCQAREYGSLDNMAAHVEYVLARCVRQAEEISKKVRAFRSLPARLRPTALRELKDNIKALETGVVRHGGQPASAELRPRAPSCGRERKRRFASPHCPPLDDGPVAQQLTDRERR